MTAAHYQGLPSCIDWCAINALLPASKTITPAPRQAESKDSNDRTYPSNLSAALYELGDYQGCFEAICRAARICSQTDDPFLLRLSTRLARCLTQGARNGTISDEAIIDEFAVIEKLKGVEFTSGSVGVMEELRSAWKEWDVILDEAIGDKVERKRSAQLDLAGMDFKRQKLYVTLVQLTDAEPLKDPHRQPSMEYFHVGFQSCLYQIYS